MAMTVLTIKEMREWETATWAAGQTEAEVIRRVGRSVAVKALAMTRPEDSILVLAGKGHNGDDARAAVETLDARTVRVLDVSSPETDLAALEKALQEEPALIIDGLFGIGLNRVLSGPWQKIIATVNAANVPVLAVDVPSGLNADTGEIFGAAIEADVTLTVGAPKTGLLAAQAWPFVGRLEVADQTGLVPCPVKGEVQWTLPSDFRRFPPSRPAAGHKGDFGHLYIIAGSLGCHGAAVLATRGAQRAQPGLTTLLTQDNVYAVIASQLQSAMVSAWQPEPKFPASVTGLLVGPGMAARNVAETFRPHIQHWWRDLPHPVVVDASGLDCLASGPVRGKAARVITPHPGEAARLLNWSTQKVQGGRLETLRELSKKYGHCWVVLKGHQTLIGRHEGEVFVNGSGNPHLAQGGSGDLLGGFIAGLLAQPPLQSDAATTLRFAVWEHGAAADRLQATRSNWVVEDLAAEIGDSRARQCSQSARLV
jgi:NAD(P)H-hydrate epimerase